MEKIPEIKSISNPVLKLDYLANSGPRLVGLRLAGFDENQFAELSDLTKATPYGEYKFLGGHRLWHAPEAFPRSYIPDQEGLIVEETTTGLLLTGVKEDLTGVRKSMQIDLHPVRATVNIMHRLSNEGLWPIEVAAWGLTMLPLQGLLVFPQNRQPLDQDALLPNRHISIWPYSSWKDPRLELDDDLITIQAKALLPPLKIGYMNTCGWIGYLRKGVLFVKHFQPKPDLPHVDFGCNAESFCSDRFIELETLSPLRKLEPGQTIEHSEKWEFFPQIPEPASRESFIETLQNLELPL